MFDKMVSHYLEEDIDGINELMDKYMSDEYAEFKEQLLLKRNKNWIPDIEKLTGKNSSFIAVGAGHLPGKDGLIDLLQQAGYKVKAIK